MVYFLSSFSNLRKALVFVLVSLFSTHLFANVDYSKVDFYWGKQKGTSEACLIGISNEQVNQVTAFAYVYQAHEGVFTHIDELTFNLVKPGVYMYESTTPGSPIKEGLLSLGSNDQWERYGVAILHHTHYDPAFCEGLSLAQGTKRSEALDFITEFESSEAPHAEEDHDHDEHDHSHEDHNHDSEGADEYDHDHGHDHDDDELAAHITNQSTKA